MYYMGNDNKIEFQSVFLRAQNILRIIYAITDYGKVDWG